MTTPGLEICGVTVSFNGSRVLTDVSLRVERGEIVAVLGPSGSGKSTLLRVIAGLVPASSGSVHVDGNDMSGIPTHRRGVGLVFQNNQLFPHLDVADNVAYGLRIARITAGQRRARVAALLALIGMSDHATRDVATLSGGEAARVALARSLATTPRILLLDEPLSGLDHDLRYSLAQELRRVIHAAGSTALLVTHDPLEAERIADRVVRLTELSSGTS
ncbi:MAG: ABC transporter ATP-binding protein [Actinobacteria bacterium]|nr:ABC transporter ATP-binding protein [Actinomycetota bacterium]